MQIVNAINLTRYGNFFEQQLLKCLSGYYEQLHVLLYHVINMRRSYMCMHLACCSWLLRSSPVLVPTGIVVIVSWRFFFLKLSSIIPMLTVHWNVRWCHTFNWINKSIIWQTFIMSKFSLENVSSCTGYCYMFMLAFNHQVLIKKYGLFKSSSAAESDSMWNL